MLAGLSAVGDVALTPHSGSNLVLMWVSQPACTLALSVVAWGYKHQESCRKPRNGLKTAGCPNTMLMDA